MNSLKIAAILLLFNFVFIFSSCSCDLPETIDYEGSGSMEINGQFQEIEILLVNRGLQDRVNLVVWYDIENVRNTFTIDNLVLIDSVFNLVEFDNSSSQVSSCFGSIQNCTNIEAFYSADVQDSVGDFMFFDVLNNQENIFEGEFQMSFTKDDLEELSHPQEIIIRNGEFSAKRQ